MVAALDKFATFAEEFADHKEGFKKIFDSVDPHRSVPYTLHAVILNIPQLAPYVVYHLTSLICSWLHNQSV